MNSARTYGIAVFHNKGDVLSCTPVARQLKADDDSCHITWFTSEQHACVLDNNPYVDEVVVLQGDPCELDAEIPTLKQSRPWTRFFTPAAYMNYEAKKGGAIFDLVKEGAQLSWTVPFVFTMRLTTKEIEQARRYWSRLPEGKKILIEWEFFSKQSPDIELFIYDISAAFRDLKPVIIFTAKSRPGFFHTFREKYPRTLWCREPYRLHAEFYNLCDAFIGVSSGISALALSDHCRPDVPHIEISLGEHWGGAVMPQQQELFSCYSRRRVLEALANVATRLRETPLVPDFSLRAPLTLADEPPSKPKMIRCPLCLGVKTQSPHKGEETFSQCKQCHLVFKNQRWAPSDKQVQHRPLTPMVIHHRVNLIEHAIAYLPKGQNAFKVADIGCGAGEVLRVVAQAGLTPLGFDPDENVSLPSDLNIQREPFFEGELPAPGADLVLFAQSLQRTPHPLEHLERIEYLLKPGGLLVCTVPNFLSMSSIALQDNWPWWEPSSNWFHFTANSLRRMLIETGFFVEEIRTDSGEYEPESLYHLVRQLVPQISEAKLPGLIEQANAQGTGEELCVVARKRGRTKVRVKSPSPLL